VNPDRALVLEFLAGDRRALPITSNPLAHDLGGVILELEAGRGSAVLAFEPPARFTQGAGVLQGGMLAAMLDFAMAFAAHAALRDERAFATATLTINLHHGARPGPLLARGRITHLGRHVIFADAELTGRDESRVLASASALLPLLQS